MHSISIRHNFEAAHRLPHLPGKCQSIHGHSFWAEVTIGTAQRLPGSGIIVEYGEAKAYVREWIDRCWDHGTILGAQDPLVQAKVVTTGEGGEVLTETGRTALGKTYLLGGAIGPQWPTVENLAWHLGLIVQEWCRARNRTTEHFESDEPMLVCESVTVRETAVNAATWINPAAS